MNKLLLTDSKEEYLYFKRISDHIRNKILSAEWNENMQIPSSHELADQFGVSRGTVLKAIKELNKDGLLISIRGKGTFVASTHIEQPLAESFISFSEDLSQKKIPFTTIVIEKKIGNFSDVVNKLLEIPNEEKVFCLRRVRHVNGKPLVYLINYVRCDLCPEILDVDYTQVRLFDAIEEKSGHKIVAGRRIFSAESADAETARWLEIKRKDPVFHLEQVSFLSNSKAIEVSFDYFNSKKYHLSAFLRRNSAADNNRFDQFPDQHYQIQ